MTAEEMLALYGREEEQAINLWRMAPQLFPRGIWRTAGEEAAGRIRAADEVRVLPGLTTGAGILGGTEAAAAGLLRAALLPGADWPMPAGNLRMEMDASRIGAGASPRETTSGAERSREGSSGKQLRESVLTAERIALGRRDDAEGRTTGFGAIYAELERRLAIELGAG